MVNRSDPSKSWYELKRYHRREVAYRSRKGKQDRDIPFEVEGRSWPSDAWMVCGVNRARCTLIDPADGALLDLAGRSGLIVGDRVMLSAARGEILYRLRRRSEMIRVRRDRTRRSSAPSDPHAIAANVDVGVVVVSKRDPPFHHRLLDRYLVMCEVGGVKPLICVNKCDLEGAEPDLSSYDALGVGVVSMSAQSGRGLDDLRAALAGCVSVLVGHSGVGKSTIVNSLLGVTAERTGSISIKSRRGRHTTSMSHVHRVDRDTFIIDTPGVRSWGLYRIDRESLRALFPEFVRIAGQCHFRDCQHIHEPDCAVRRDANVGLISSQRYQSYLRLLDEISP